MNPQTITRHQRRRLETRRKLQQALQELVLEKGYESVSIQEITDRADLGRGTFYVHFHDKEELLWSLVADRIHSTEQAAVRLLQELDGRLPEQPEFYGYVNIFEHVAQNQDLYRVLLGKQGHAGMADRVRAYMAAETLQDMERMGLYSDLGQPPEITAQIVVGAIISLAIWWLEAPERYTPCQVAAMLYEALHHRKPPATLNYTV